MPGNRRRIALCRSFGRLGLLLVAWYAVLSAAEPSRLRERLASRVVDLVLLTEYEDAFALADSCARENRGEAPLFPVLKLTAMGLREMDLDVALDSEAFDTTYAHVMTRIDSYAAQSTDSAAVWALRGYATATYAAYKARHGRYFGAVRLGLSAIEELEKAVDRDSSVVDAYYFLGLYDWSQAQLKRRLWWVMFWLPGDRERGIRRLERCRRGKGFASSAATLSLVDIYTSEARYSDAERLLEELRSRYGSSRFVLWGEARFWEAQQEWQHAAVCYERLAASYENEPFGEYNALACRYHQALSYERAGLTAQVQSACSELLRRCDSGEGTLGERAQEICSDAGRLIRRLDSHMRTE